MEDASRTRAEAPAAEPPAEVLRIGRYVVLARLGEGAMGVVYSAYDEALDRKVALKLLRARAGHEGASRLRMQREAQALAQLSHPNVVQVYDVGEWHGQVFLALEFIHGRTLARWLREAPRGWQEVVEVFAQAGRGLAAAHAAGMVHRDIKPDNLLVGHDGRVRIADFGLALVPTEGEAPPELETSQSGRSVIRVTATGAMIGTPAYMAPEQFLRQPGDARTDQFGYCAALFEALFGYRPYAGDTVAQISRHVLLGERLAPPPRSPVPMWLQGLVARGLESDPERRFASMEALLAELTRDRGRTRRALAWAAGAAAAVAGAVALQLQGSTVCQGAREHLVGVWDEPRRAAVEAALQATGVAYAGETWVRVAQTLDAYADAWAERHTAACQAHQRGEQSSAALDLRMGCLQQRRGALQALVGVLSEADAQTVSNAVQAARGLPGLASCDDLERLEEEKKIGATPDPAAAPRVAALRQHLAEIESLHLAGNYARAIERGRAASAEAEAIAFVPALAEAQFWVGRTLLETGEMQEAAATLRRAYLSAVRAGHEVIQARALIALVYVQGYGNHAFRAADEAYAVVHALLERIAPDGILAAELLNNQASSRLAERRGAEAQALNRQALELRRRSGSSEHEIATTLSNLANDLVYQGLSGEAEPLHREAVALFERGLGPHHPMTFVSHGNLALALADLGREDEARALLVDNPLLEPGSLGHNRPDFADTFTIRGLLRLRDEPEAALADLEHGYALGERLGLPVQRWRTRFGLARGLWERAPERRARALELARAGLEDAVAEGLGGRVAEIEAWLREREAAP